MTKCHTVSYNRRLTWTVTNILTHTNTLHHTPKHSAVNTNGIRLIQPILWQFNPAALRTIARIHLHENPTYPMPCTALIHSKRDTAHYGLENQDYTRGWKHRKHFCTLLGGRIQRLRHQQWNAQTRIHNSKNAHTTTDASVCLRYPLAAVAQPDEKTNAVML